MRDFRREMRMRGEEFRIFRELFVFLRRSRRRCRFGCSIFRYCLFVGSETDGQNISMSLRKKKAGQTVRFIPNPTGSETNEHFIQFAVLSLQFALLYFDCQLSALFLLQIQYENLLSAFLITLLNMPNPVTSISTKSFGCSHWG